MKTSKKVKIGSVCRCRLGRIGMVTSKNRADKNSNEMEYYGYGFDGKPWQSKEPEFLAENVNEYLVKKQTGTL